MNFASQRLCAHTAPLWLFFCYLGLFVMSGWHPPFSPSLSIAETASTLQDDTWMRIGMAVVAFASPLFMGIAMPIYVQLKRLEGHNQVWANFQMCSAAVGVLALQFPGLFWLAATYRSDMSADVVVGISDMAFFMILGGITPAIMQNVAIACGILFNKSDKKVFPRWLGYYNLWIAFSFFPGAILPFVHSGPFAWSGVFGFWVVIIGFAAWMLVQWVYTLKAIRHHENEVLGLKA